MKPALKEKKNQNVKSFSDSIRILQNTYSNFSFYHRERDKWNKFQTNKFTLQEHEVSIILAEKKKIT